MVLDRLRQLTTHISSSISPPPPHPFDPLSAAEIEQAVRIVNAAYGPLAYNAVTLHEPRKAEMLEYLASPDGSKARPSRVADVVAIKKGGAVFDGLVDLEKEKVMSWTSMEGVQPLITMEDLQAVEHVVRVDEGVIEQCGIVGIRREDMGRVYCDRECGFSSSPFPFRLGGSIPYTAQRLMSWQRGRLDTMSDSETRYGCSKH